LPDSVTVDLRDIHKWSSPARRRILLDEELQGLNGGPDLVITECIHLFRLTFDFLAALSRSHMITGSPPGGQFQTFGSAEIQNRQLL
jgi:hypothetical protein